jgi:hypothetical protein
MKFFQSKLNVNNSSYEERMKFINMLIDADKKRELLVNAKGEEYLSRFLKNI